MEDTGGFVGFLLKGACFGLLFGRNCGEFLSLRYFNSHIIFDLLYGKSWGEG